MNAQRWRLLFGRPERPFRQAHPVTLTAKLYHDHPETRPTACRCPGGPCRVHPFVFDYESLLRGR